MKMIEPWFDDVIETVHQRPLTVPATQEKTGLENAAPFKLHKRSNYPPLTALANRLFCEMQWPNTSHKGETTRKKYVKRLKHNLRSILIDVFAKYEEDSTQHTAFSRNKNDYRLRDWLNKAKITPLIITCVDTLAENGYLEINKGINYKDYPRLSRIRATAKLIDQFESVRGNVSQLYASVEDMADIVRLKNQKKKYIDYEDTDYSIAARSLLSGYNAMMSTHDLSHLWAYQNYAPMKKTQLHRAFNNGCWSAGGRYAGAGYQHMPRALRQGLLIDGRQTVELDFSATFLTLAYNLQGHNYWNGLIGPQDGAGDPYRPFLYESKVGLENKQLRYLNKKIVNTFLMAKTKEMSFEDAIRLTAKAVQQDLNNHKYHSDEDKRLLYPGIFLYPVQSDKRCSLVQYIEKYLREDGPHGTLDWDAVDGMFLMFIESEIATMVMKFFTDLNKPVLVIHDSFIVKEEDEELLYLAMRQAWSKTLQIYSINTNEVYLCNIKRA